MQNETSRIISSAASPTPPTSMFLRMPSVVRLTGLGRSTIYRLMNDSKFPRPVKLAERAVAWRRSNIDRWSEERQIANK